MRPVPLVPRVADTLLAMKSLLSAALSRGGPAEGPPADPSAGKLDDSSFPCIADRKAASGVDDVTASLQKLDVKRTPLPGSAPTATHLAGTYTVSWGPGSVACLCRGASILVVLDCAQHSRAPAASGVAKP